MWPTSSSRAISAASRPISSLRWPTWCWRSCCAVCWRWPGAACLPDGHGDRFHFMGYSAQLAACGSLDPLAVGDRLCRGRLLRAGAAGDPAPGHAHGHSAYRRLSGAAGEEHGTRLDRGLSRVDQDCADTDQCHFPTLRYLWNGGADLFRHMLSPDGTVAPAGAPADDER